MTANPRRRWFSFRLRTLFVLITLLCLLLGYVVHKRRDSARQRAAISKAEANFGVSVRYRGRVDDWGLDWRQRQPAWREWLSWLLGVYAYELRCDEEYIESRPGFPDLQEFPDLEVFNCRGAYPKDLEELRKISGLESVNLSGNPAITDLSPLAGHRQLSMLWIEGACVRDLRPLAGLSHLFYFQLRENLAPIDDLAPLALLRELEILDLSNVPADLSPLAGLPNLRSLEISGPELSDLAPLASVTTITDLSCVRSPVKDLRPLSGLTNLDRLDLGRTPVVDIAPLANLTKLTSLNLEFTHVTDVAPLVSLPKLKSLYITGAPITSTESLKNLRHLKNLSVRFDQFSAEALAELRAALPNIDISVNSDTFDPAPDANSDSESSQAAVIP